MPPLVFQTLYSSRIWGLLKNVLTFVIGRVTGFVLYTFLNLTETAFLDKCSSMRKLHFQTLWNMSIRNQPRYEKLIFIKPHLKLSKLVNIVGW